MPELVHPKTFMIGFTTVDRGQLFQYLEATGQQAFMEDFLAHVGNWPHADPGAEGEALCSFYAKLCYSSLVEGRNDNISRVRAIPDNVEATINHRHGSVFEHVWINFVTTDCSRVFTHEMVRHRVGTAFSQTSGRYVRTDSIRFVMDPILEPVQTEIEHTLAFLEAQYQALRVRLGLCTAEERQWFLDRSDVLEEEDLPQPVTDMGLKKQLTSALRRLLPDGRANEIGWSINLRSLRHVIQMRTSRHAEWEIRKVFADVFGIVSEKYPLIFADARVEVVDGLPEVTGMGMNPYEAPRPEAP